MHVPRWFTIATVLLSIFFLIWLCFVIPASAPKKKVLTEEVKTIYVYLNSNEVFPKQIGGLGKVSQ